MSSKTVVSRNNCTILKIALLYSCLISRELCVWGEDNAKESLSTREFFNLLIKTHGWRRKIDEVIMENGDQVNVTDFVIPTVNGFSHQMNLQRLLIRMV
ncbi:hypothetical protein Y032_0099g3150 [Ancylostoma ceylanicum]|uniref:Uncharacterized protein n=1 Tax=Ancylostoma ceylanicum TaxID=53326 RepID=A0A016THS1_9BILA|nr:hypothetical protein Y032_0099g3150 [Ancylostoma ceylanicum]